MIRKTETRDIAQIDAIYDEARRTIASLGIDQWQNGYPSAEVVEEDIALSRSYCVETDGKICGTFALINDGEPTYDKIYEGHWKTGDNYRTYTAIHRVAVSVANRGSGVSGSIIEYASEFARKMEHGSLRIDTHRGNVVMRRMLEKNGFEYCGIIYLENGDERVAYEKILI